MRISIDAHLSVFFFLLSLLSVFWLFSLGNGTNSLKQRFNSSMFFSVPNKNRHKFRPRTEKLCYNEKKRHFSLLSFHSSIAFNCICSLKTTHGVRRNANATDERQHTIRTSRASYRNWFSWNCFMVRLWWYASQIFSKREEEKKKKRGKTDVCRTQLLQFAYTVRWIHSRKLVASTVLSHPRIHANATTGCKWYGFVIC